MIGSPALLYPSVIKINLVRFLWKAAAHSKIQYEHVGQNKKMLSRLLHGKQVINCFFMSIVLDIKLLIREFPK
jgi:hypothetical protein